MVSQTVTIQIQNQSIISLPFHNGVLLGIFLPCSRCYPFLGYCDANHSWFCCAPSSVRATMTDTISASETGGCGVIEFAITGCMALESCLVCNPMSLCRLLYVAADIFLIFEAPAPTASTSPGNLLEMQILSPHSGSAESETWDETQRSVYWQAFQVIRVHKGWWSILGLEVIRRYKSKKMLKASQGEMELGERTPDQSCDFSWRIAKRWPGREEARSPSCPVLQSPAEPPHWPNPIRNKDHRA